MSIVIRFGLFVVSCICDDILKDNKIPNLFCNNKCSSVYERLACIISDYAMLLNSKYDINRYKHIL